jgi:hypothetical protein
VALPKSDVSFSFDDRQAYSTCRSLDKGEDQLLLLVQREGATVFMVFQLRQPRSRSGQVRPM